MDSTLPFSSTEEILSPSSVYTPTLSSSPYTQLNVLPLEQASQEVEEDEHEDEHEDEDSSIDREEEEEEGEPFGRTQPLLSVLNIVVDHAMVPPTPMEPNEFQMMQQHNHKENILVPVLRIFGPVQRNRLEKICNSPRNPPSTTKQQHQQYPSPLQSACLYIHEAYPYLLARPQVAGPDGSFHHATHQNGGETQATQTSASPSPTMMMSGGCINWDNVDSVQGIVGDIQANLEATIQSSMRNNNSTDNTKSVTPLMPTRVIRKITIVVGRGFYTYCPGPAAPFLKVEYYDPKLRWKVKLVLERGLEGLPLSYHPDPHQYDYKPAATTATTTNNAKDAELERLQFHCYEAHIPYTMQFFKDYNLAGMSHIHIRGGNHGSGRFRHPMPKTVRQRFAVQEASLHASSLGGTEAAATGNTCRKGDKSHLNGNMDREDRSTTRTIDCSSSSETADDFFFLANNVPSRYVWDDKKTTEQINRQHDRSGGILDTEMLNAESPLLDTIAAATLPPIIPVVPTPSTCNDESSSPFWTKKETTCDVEFDASTKDILNVESVMTRLPYDPAEREQMHWRAVPSLRQIWRQERQRMTTLLRPKDDFLSQQQHRQQPPSHSTGTSTSTPSSSQPLTTREEGKAGDDNDDDDDDTDNKDRATAGETTPPFTLNVKKGASVPGARLAVAGMDRLFQLSRGLEEDYRRAMSDIVQRYSRVVNRVDDQLLARSARRTRTKLTLLSSITETPNKHASTIQTETSRIENECKPTPTMDEAIEALGALEAQFCEGGTNDEEAFVAAADSNMIGSSLDDTLTPLSQFESPMLTSSQALEHDPTASLEDWVELSQRVDRGDDVVRLLSTQENKELSSRVEDFINPQTLTPYDDPEDLLEDDGEGFLAEEEEMNETDFEKTLSVLATQSFRYNSGQTSLNKKQEYSQHCYRSNKHQTNDILSPIEPPVSQPVVLDTVEEDNTDESIDDDVLGSDDENKPCVVAKNDISLNPENASPSMNTAESDSTCRLALPQGSSKATSSCYKQDNITCIQLGRSLLTPNVSAIPVTFIERFRCAPTRGEITGQSISSSRKYQGLYPLPHNNETAPLWLSNALAYQKLRMQVLSREGRAYQCFPLAGGTAHIEPVKRPPNRGKLRSWLNRKRKRENTPASENAASKQRREKSVNLDIDRNSRKLIEVTTPVLVDKEKRTKFLKDQQKDISGDGQEVEEVQWDEVQGARPQSQSQNLADFLSMQSPGASTQQDDRKIKIKIKKYSEHQVFSDSQLKISHSSIVQGTKGAMNQRAKNKLSGLPSTKLDTPSPSISLSHTESQAAFPSDSQNSHQPLDGIGNQGGRIHIQGGGGLKATTRGDSSGRRSSTNSLLRGDTSLDIPSPLTIMSIEIHVQCRTGRAGVNDSKEVAMRPDSDRDMVFAVTYVYGRDPGGGEKIQILERGCLVAPVETEKTDYSSGNQVKRVALCMPKRTMGVSSKLVVQTVRDERQLLLRLASIVQWKDPDMLLSWDTQNYGLGYLIERGAVLGKQVAGVEVPHGSGPPKKVDLARLLGRTPRSRKVHKEKQSNDSFSMNEQRGDKKLSTSDGKDDTKQDHQWEGSGLGNEWDDRVGAGAASASIVGRLVFCAWKLVAEEVKHPNASYLPAIVATVLNKRLPYHDDLQLTRWYGAAKGRERWRVLQHKLSQGIACILLFDALDIIGRAGEAARLSGVEFSQSFPGIRGSQYKVEGVLLRALKSIQSDERGAKRGRQRIKSSDNPISSMSNESNSQTQSPWKMRRKIAQKNLSKVPDTEVDIQSRSYFFYSPSLQDSSRQEALECQAMTLEPQSGCVRDPVVVCDFTALYPSLVIAYNLCYSTCSGKLDYHSTRKEMGQFGKTTGRLGPFLYSESRTATVLSHHMKSLADDKDRNSTDDLTNRRQNDRAYVVPTGTIFLSESVLKGVLPQVLDEILSTRAMLKKAAKEYKRLVPDLSPAILRQLEARQLALKYVANVTYGYTSATFSGRCAMPLLADAIVECGRRTLSNAINLANKWGRESDGKWKGAEVIYGDTDSLFVKLPGRSVTEAFEFGKSFCKAVTAANPPPVQLKLEKVYSASMMQTKKKYCGMKYESADQKKPVFEAKGIETVRRDQCALTQKVLRNALVTLFRSGLEAVRAYLYRQWSMILAGRLPVSDFILTGRVRSKYRGGRIGPVQAVLARRLAEADPGRTIQHKERLAYVITATPGLTFRLKDCVLTPMELLEQWDAYSIHSAYYITKHVNAALQRCLGLAPYRVDVNAWYEACPKPRRRIHNWPITRSGSSVMISSYFGSDICGLCGSKCKAKGNARAVVCASCQEDRVKASYTALTRLNRAQQDVQSVAKICSDCNGCYESASTFAASKEKISEEKYGETAGTLGMHSVSKSAKSAPGIVTPIANCSCIDCPNTYERHRLHETELEAVAICKALELI